MYVRLRSSQSSPSSSMKVESELFPIAMFQSPTPEFVGVEPDRDRFAPAVMACRRIAHHGYVFSGIVFRGIEATATRVFVPRGQAGTRPYGGHVSLARVFSRTSRPPGFSNCRHSCRGPWAVRSRFRRAGCYSTLEGNLNHKQSTQDVSSSLFKKLVMARIKRAMTMRQRIKRNPSPLFAHRRRHHRHMAVVRMRETPARPGLRRS